MPTQIDMSRITTGTMGMLNKSATSGIFGDTGAWGVDLTRFLSLVPVNVPARMNTKAFSRQIAGMGSPTAMWRSWLNINNQQPSSAMGRDYAAARSSFEAITVQAPYNPVGYAGIVTLDAVALGRSYVDEVAQAKLYVLDQVLIGQDMLITNAQGWALPAMGSITLTPSATGGTIGASLTVFVAVAPRSGANYFDGGSAPASASVSVAVSAGTTNSVSATWAAVKGAVAYDIYVGTAAGSMFYYTTTSIGTVTITSIPTSGASNPIPSINLMPLMSQLRPGAGCLPLANPPVAGNGTPPTVDNSYSANYYNGVIASSLGDYSSVSGGGVPVTPGTGIPSGAIFIDNGGNAPAAVSSGGGVDILDKLCAQIWNSVQLSPTAFMMNSNQGQEISNILKSSPSASTLLPPTDADARINLAGGGFVSRYINMAAGGVPVAIEIHPRVPPGTIIARTDYVPFPGSDIGSVFAVRCQYDTSEFQYATAYQAATFGGGPSWQFEVRSMETLINAAPSAQGIATNIA